MILVYVLVVQQEHCQAREERPDPCVKYVCVVDAKLHNLHYCTVLSASPPRTAHIPVQRCGALWGRYAWKRVVAYGILIMVCKLLVMSLQYRVRYPAFDHGVVGAFTAYEEWGLFCPERSLAAK